MSVELTLEQVENLIKHENIKNIRPVSKCGGSAQSMDWGYIATKVDVRYKGIYTGNGVDVAIIDTGLAYHEDLPTAYQWVDYVNSQSSQYDDNDHGTFCAGIIAGQDNSIGCIGVSPNVRLFIAKVLGSDNRGYTDDLISGIDWALSQGVDIINFAISMDDDSTPEDKQLLIDACRRAYNAGIIVVSCSGNGTLSEIGWDSIGKSTVSCPAYDYSCVAVGSINQDEIKSSFSNYGTGLDLVAPGEDVWSTSCTGYSWWSGTSFATAYVTGHLACLKEKYPSYTRSQLVSELLSNCKTLGDSWEYGAGLVQAELPPIPETPSSPPVITSRIEQGLNLSWGVSTNAISYKLRCYYGTELIVNTYNTTYTLTNLAYGTSYELSVKGVNDSGESAYTSINIGTTAPESPGDITCPLVSANDIDIRVADGMSGNWDYIRVYKYDNSNNLLGYLDLSKSNYSNGQRVITFSGLTTNTEYKFNAVTHYTVNSTLLESVYWSNDLYVATSVPSIPSSAPVVTSKDEGILRLSWGTSENAATYTLRYKHYDGIYHTISGINGTTCVLSGLEFGVTYYLSVKGVNDLGSSNYTTENLSTTLAKTPGNLTCPAKTLDTIDIRVADGMTGNWDYIRVYAYDNSISPSYKDITYTEYQNSIRIVTWTNLTSGLQYRFIARTYYTYNSEVLDSFYYSSYLYVTTSSRPDNFNWTTPKVQGNPATNLAATEWNNFCSKINEFRQYKSLSTITFTTVSSGGIFYASIFNEARNAIYPMNSTNLPSTKLGVSDVVDPNDADDLLASDLNALVSCLNAII